MTWHLLFPEIFKSGCKCSGFAGKNQPVKRNDDPENKFSSSVKICRFDYHFFGANHPLSSGKTPLQTIFCRVTN
jgi:hypothetical protein